MASGISVSYSGGPYNVGDSVEINIDAGEIGDSGGVEWDVDIDDGGAGGSWSGLHLGDATSGQPTSGSGSYTITSYNGGFISLSFSGGGFSYNDNSGGGVTVNAPAIVTAGFWGDF